LDIASKNVLKQALQDFEGTLIIVSHDRDFLQGLTNKVYEFKNNRIKEYLGDIDYYLEEHNLDNLREVERITQVSVKKESPAKEDYKDAKQKEKELKQLQNKLSKVETQIADLEKEIKKIDSDLADPITYEKLTSTQNFFANYQSKKDKIDSLMIEWETLHSSIEELG
jgi:ATP-binding cassette subfamily F protein 3